MNAASAYIDAAAGWWIEMRLVGNRRYRVARWIDQSGRRRSRYLGKATSGDVSH